MIYTAVLCLTTFFFFFLLVPSASQWRVGDIHRVTRKHIYTHTHTPLVNVKFEIVHVLSDT